MKIILPSALCVLLVSILFAQTPAVSQDTTTSGSGNPFLNQTKTNTTDDLRKAISKNAYSWEGKGFSDKTVKFDANGTGKQSDFEFKWHIKNAQEIDIVAINAASGNAKVRIKFSQDYTTFVGIDFDGIRELKGQQIMPKTL